MKQATPPTAVNQDVRAAAESRAATLASIETGTHMLVAALRQMVEIDSKLERLSPGTGRRLESDRAEVGTFIAEHLDRFLPAHRCSTPRDGVRPLPSRVASARTVESWRKR